MEALWESAAGSPLASVSPGSKPSLAFSWGCSRLTPAIYRATYFLHTYCPSTYLPTYLPYPSTYFSKFLPTPSTCLFPYVPAFVLTFLVKLTS